MALAEDKIKDLLEFSAELARQSGETIMRYFRHPIAVERKADASPVTRADREAESLLRRLIEARYPDHQVLGEEGGLSGRDRSPYQWVLDPIDGTQSFIHGVPLFGTLIALLEEGEPILGAIHLPATQELLLGGRGLPTTLNGKAVRVSQEDKLAQATLLITCPSELFDLGQGEAFHRLRKKVRLVRGWGDCYGHFLVATGRADIMLDPILNLWDIAALKPCVEGAGGRLTDISGEGSRLGESALSTNGRLHDEVLALLDRESQ